MLAEDIRERVKGLIEDENFKPLKIDDLVGIFVENKDDIEEFTKLIYDMFADGELYINKKLKVGSLEAYSMKKGIYMSTKRGFGFVSTSRESNKELKDIFIHEDDRNGAFDGDSVLVKITKQASGDFREEGVIIKILNRANSKIVGLFKENKSFAFVIPDNKKFDQDIFISKNYFSGAKDNDKVVCEIIQWPEDDKKPEGKVIEVIGKSGERYVEIDSIVRAHSLPETFSEKVVAQVQNVNREVLESELIGRLDLRDELIYTIDGDDSKDFDDAVCVEKLGNGNYKLGVHIADVTHYVTEYSPLDREALKRGTSVYLVDKVIPMLPKELSNGICSLNPNVDRLTLSCIMEVDPVSAKVVNHEIVESVIRSKARLTYHEVSEFLENGDEAVFEKLVSPEEEKNDLYENLKNAEELSKLLRNKRMKRGAIDFDFPESKIILDEAGVPKDIQPYERRLSNKLIEEFMLLANETVSEHYFWLKVPFVYRVHELPDEEKIMMLGEYLKEMGVKFHFSRGGIRPSDLQKVLDSIEDGEKKQAIGAIMLRTLRQARYSPECLGHFGLAAKYYSHFTSPIRRYPDLQIHRIIKEQLAGKLSSKRLTHYESILYEVSDQSSVLERKAELAEREVDDYYKAVYMEDKTGEKFDGHISSITSFGMFVELPNGVEGLIRLEKLDDYYEYHERTKTLVGEHSGNVFRLGQKVKIVVENVSVPLREIDFSLSV